MMPSARVGSSQVPAIRLVARVIAPSDDPDVDTNRRISEDVHVLACAECPRVSSVTAGGWKAYRVDDPEENEPPELAFYCPACARREFGSL
jgi:hypothetical protein